MQILISSSTGLAIYEQIRIQVKEAILNNELKDGEQLPSIRHLASELRVSVITTARAYDELEKEGLISPIQGKGYFVTLDKERLREEWHCKIEQQILIAIDYCKSAKINKDSFMGIVNYLIDKEF